MAPTPATRRSAASSTTAAAARRARPRRVRKPYDVSYRLFTTSPEVVLATLATLVSYILAMTMTSNTRVTGAKGSLSTVSQPALRHLQSREAQRQADPPAQVSVDLVLICACVLSVNALVGACVRVLLKERRRIETDVQAKAKAEAEAAAAAAASAGADGGNAAAITANGQAHVPETGDGGDNATTSSSSAALASSSTGSSSGGTVATTTGTATAKGEVEYYFDEDMITNVLVAIGLVYSLLAALYVLLQEANEARGYSAIASMLVLVGAIVCPRLGHGLLTVQHYCGIVNNITLLLLLIVLARCAVGNAARPPRLLAFLVGMA